MPIQKLSVQNWIPVGRILHWTHLRNFLNCYNLVRTALTVFIHVRKKRMDIFRSDVFFRNVMVCLVRDRSIFIGIRDREICNGTTGYFGPLVERGHRLFWGLALRGHGLFQCRISTGPKIILKYSGMGSWTIFSFSSLFHIKNTGPEQIYTTGLRFILEGDFNGAVENFWPSGYGAIHYLAW